MTDTPYEADLLNAVKRRQKASLTGSLVTALVLIAGVAGFLYYSVSQIAEKQRELAAATTQLADVTARLQSTQAQLAMLEAVVTEKTKEADDATNLAKQIYPLNWADAKTLFGQFGRASRLIEVIMQAQQGNAHWGFGESMEGGFTSPGFANYILARAAGPSVTYESLPLRQGAPRPGDIIRYDPPYTMFYFPDVGPSERNEGFVIGMTPLGVTSLSRSFTPKIVEIRRTPFSQ